ncbi:MAG TPA: hypothetical protein VGN37_04630 [Actinocatenispora sp.]
MTGPTPPPAGITELVALPDPGEHPLVHPLDLPAARGDFRRAQLITALTNPAVAVCVAGVVWFGSHAVMPPLLAGTALLVFGILAARCLENRAWQYVPRNRQDRDRRLPLRYRLGTAVPLGATLTVALLLTAWRLGRPDVTADVREYTFGAAAAVALMVIADLARTAARRDRAGRLPGQLPPAIGYLAAVTVAYPLLFGPGGAAWSGTMLAGAVTLLGLGIALAVWHLIDRHRTAAQP